MSEQLDKSSNYLDSITERAKNVFHFLSEVKKLSSPVISDFDRYEQVLWLCEIPRDSGCFTKAWEVVGQPADAKCDAWVEIKKPVLSAPPELPDGLDLFVNEKEWRDSSCEQPSLLELSREQLIRHFLPDEDLDPEVHTLKIDDNEDIFEQYVNYVDDSWKVWAKTQAAEDANKIDFPQPPESLLPWLDRDKISDFTLTEPPLLDVISVEIDTKFQQAKEALENDWNDYLNQKWFVWAQEDRRLQKIQKIYNQLYSVYQKSQKLGEQYEVVVAFGLLGWKGPKSGSIRRHVLTAEASIQFDSRHGILSVVAPSSGTRLVVEDDMLHSEERPQPAEKLRLDEQSKEVGDIFWDQAVLSDLLKSFVNSLQYSDGSNLQSSGQFELQLERSERILEKPVIDFAPAIILRKRSQRGFIRLLQEIEKRIESDGIVPRGIQSIVSGAETMDNDSSEDGDSNSQPNVHDAEVYFPLPANGEQKQIVRYLNKGRGVRVQGPPGTGKSHTIANLICHLLATGKRVLVTSETERALKSLRSKFSEGAAPLSDLAVILLGNDSKSMLDLEKSVSAINKRKEIWRKDVSLNRITYLEAQLDEVRRSKRVAENNLRAVRESDVYIHNLKYGRYSGTLQQIATEVSKEREKFSWFTDLPNPECNPIDIFKGNPENVVKKWSKWKLSDLIDSDPSIASIQSLPTFESFQAEVAEHKRIQNRLLELRSAIDEKLSEQLSDTSISDTHEIAKTAGSILAGLRNLKQHIHSWSFEAGKQIVAEQDRSWRELFEITTQELENCSNIAKESSNLEVTGIEDSQIRQIKTDVAILIAYGQQGKKIKKSLFQPKNIKNAFAAIKSITLDGKAPKSLQDLEKLSKWLITKDSLNVLKNNWSGIASFPPSTMMSQVVRYQDFLEPLEIALDLHAKVQYVQRQINEFAKFEAPRWHVLEDLEKFCQTFEYRELLYSLDEVSNRFVRYNAEAVAVMRVLDGKNIELENAIREQDPLAYKRCIDQIKETNEISKEQKDILAVARALRTKLPNIYSSFVRSDDPELWIRLFSQLERAWQWKLADCWLEDLCDPKALQNLNNSIEHYASRERTILGELAAERAWSFCMERLTESQRQSLVAWLQAIDRVGKGTGRHAEKHRKVARQKLQECQSAIPAWVMPLHKVVETVDATPELFDVAIIDEASQSGSEALILNYIAKKVIVVGDDKQIRPQTPGINHDDVEHLRKRYLGDVPHSETFDLNSSFFSQTEVRFPNQVTLKEHFRCMPEIIQFSNNHFYQASPLIPLKQFGSDRLKPVVPIYVEDGYRIGSSSNTYNEPEARRLVDQVAECCSHPDYDGKSMGIITLLGHSQAPLIEDLLMKEIEAEEYESRKIMVGSAYAFQGDERDVIFISMVDAPENGMRCRAVTKAEKQREFNVAASRAKEQMFLFHSATLNDLKEDCLQYKLLSHCLNPEAKQLPVIGKSIDELRQIVRESERVRGNQPQPFDSWFEVDVFMKLADRGYRVIPQYIINPNELSYRIDLVVEGMQRRLAIECDGDEWHGPESYDRDMARQRELERCGWEFWRIRGGAYYRDPEASMNSLWDLLSKRGIFPEGYIPKEPETVKTEEPEQEGEALHIASNEQVLMFNDEGLEENQNDNGKKRAQDLTPKEIQEGLLRILKVRPNNSIAVKSISSELCRYVGVRTRGNPRRELDKRISRSIGVLKREGVIEEYKSKNLRVRLLSTN